MVTLHEVITFLVSMQISISSLQTHNVNRCGRSRHLARKLSLRRRSEERFSRNAETDLVCRLLLEKKKIRGYLALLHLQRLRRKSCTRSRRGRAATRCEQHVGVEITQLGEVS